MKIPVPSAQYDRYAEAQRNRILEQADTENHKRNRDVSIGLGRLLLTSDNGYQYELCVDAFGVLQLKALGTAPQFITGSTHAGLSSFGSGTVTN